MAKKTANTPAPRYVVRGIDPPGMVDVYPYGEVMLYECSDITLEQLYNLGCTFVQPVVEVTQPDTNE